MSKIHIFTYYFAVVWLVCVPWIYFLIDTLRYIVSSQCVFFSWGIWGGSGGGGGNNHHKYTGVWDTNLHRQRFKCVIIITRSISFHLSVTMRLFLHRNMTIIFSNFSMCIYVYEWGHTCAHLYLPGHMCGDQGTIYKIWLPPSTIWILVIECWVSHFSKCR